MQFASTGGIFLRIDNNANLGIFDQAGNERVVIANGILSGNLNKSVQVVNGLISTTTSTSNVSMGLGCSITPLVSGNVLVLGLVSLANNTASDIATFSIYQNTTAVPSGGTSVGTDTQKVSTNINNNANTALLTVPGTLFTLVTGLALGTKYFFYIAGSVTPGGTGTIAGATGSIVGLEL